MDELDISIHKTAHDAEGGLDALRSAVEHAPTLLAGA